MEVTWLGEFREEDGELNFRIGRTGGDLIAEWAGFCTLRADRMGTRSELTALPGADPAIVAKLHAGLARALLRHLQGKLTLHASAVSVDGELVACFGESEAGKSTTAAHLSARAGAVFFADDTAAIEFRDGCVEILPTETVSWLRPAAHAALGFGETALKTPVSPAQVATAVKPLAALVKLAFDDAVAEPRLRRVHGQEALAMLVPSVVRFVIDEPAVQLHEFDQLQALARAVPIFELTRARRLSALDASCDAILGIVHALRAGDAA